MKQLKEYIEESLLDDFDVISNNLDAEVIKNWCDEHLKGKYKITILKKAYTVKLYGDVVIKGVPDEKIPFKIVVMDGNLNIEKCPNLQTLEGLFEEFMTVKGNLSINNCPKLTSLKGCPFIVSGSFSLTGNSSLKSLEGAPEIVHGTTYIMKNGKKFSEDKIKEFIKMPTRVVCSNEEECEVIEEGMINEALNEPHLLELVNQLKASKHFSEYRRIIFNRFNIKWDDIDSSNVMEFNKIDNNALRIARNIIAGRDGLKGLLMLRDHTGKYKSLISNDKDILYIRDYTYSNSPYSIPMINWRDEKSSELIYNVQHADSMVVIMWDKSWVDDVYKLRRNRRDSRDGMVLNTPEYYEQIARENIKRYKQIIAKNRANGINPKEFEQIDSDVELIVQKALEFTRNTRKNFKDVVWDAAKVDIINRSIYDQQHYMDYSKGKAQYTGEDGLLYLYSEFIRAYMRFKDSGESYYENTMKQRKSQLMSKIQELKIELGI